MPDMASIASGIWIAALAQMLDYALQTPPGHSGIATGICVGLLPAVLLASRSRPPGDQLLSAGAIYFSLIPLSRASVIHFDSVAWVLPVWLFGGWWLVGLRMNLVVAMTTLSVALLDRALESVLQNSTQPGYVIGVATMAIAACCESGKQVRTLLVLVVSVLLCAVDSHQSGSKRAGRFSVLSVPYRDRQITHLLLEGGRTRFVSTEEQRFHACSTQLPIFWLSQNRKTPKSALIIFGGDGLIARNLLAVRSIKKITILDTDRSLVHLSKMDPILRSYNLDSLSNPRTEVIFENPFNWSFQTEPNYDLIIVDLPRTRALYQRKYYSREFIKQLATRLTASGVLALIMNKEFAPGSRDEIDWPYRWHAFQEKTGQRLFYIHTPLKRPMLSYGTGYLAQQCQEMKAQNRIGFDSLKTMIMSEGGEGKAQRLMAQSVTRLSLPR